MSNLVFIAGPGRSGSTILQASLDSHPELLVFPLVLLSWKSYANGFWRQLGSDKSLF